MNISWVSTWHSYLSETHEKGVPARAKVVIWYQFSTPRGTFWLKKGKEVRKRVAKTLGFHIQNEHRSAFCWGQIAFLVVWGSKSYPKSILEASKHPNAFLECARRSRRRTFTVFEPILAPKLFQNWSKIKQTQKKYKLQNQFWIG